MRLRSLFLLVCAAAAAAGVPARAQTVSTVAGGGSLPGEAANDWGANGPAGVAVDARGNLYVAVTGGNQVWVVNSSGVVTEVIGNGTAGYSGDGGPAASAELNGPWGVAVDSSGNLYIADGENNVIRKVSVTTGIISTFAGNGTYGYSGDGRPATSAELSYPNGVAVDSSGNLYIADTGDSVIRKVSAATGIISTFAGNGTAGYSGDGGPATSAELSNPAGVAVDSSGNLYIADTDDSVIRKVSAATGNIGTVAGNRTYGYSGNGGRATSAALAFPDSVAVDSSGNLYIADTYNCVIREVSATTGNIGTVAGNGTCGYSGDGHSSGRHHGGRATSVELAYPTGVVVDSSGNLYIADASNNLIRKVSAATGNIGTVAGNGSCCYGGDGGAATSAELAYPKGIAVDSTGNLYIADSENNVIREVSARTGIIGTVAGNFKTGGGYRGDGGPATSAGLNNPTGVAVDSSGNLYIADTDDNVIRKVWAATGNIGTVAGNGTHGYSGDGGAATSAALAFPDSVAVDSSGNLYIADTYNCVIREVSARTGNISTVAGNGTCGYSGDGGRAASAELAYPTGVVVDSSGNLYIADWSNNVIREVSAATGIISTIAGNGAFGFSGDGGAAASAELANPSGIALSSAGRVYVADSGNNRIRALPGPATPNISWPAPASIASGTALSATQLDATANVSGTFVYTPAAGTVLSAGNNQTLSVTFTPSDILDYTTATATTTISVTSSSNGTSPTGESFPSTVPSQ